MANFQMNVTLSDNDQITTARIADGTGAANQLNDNDVGKFLKVKGDSQYGLCAVGEEIEAILNSGADNATHNGYAIGSVRRKGRSLVTLDGLQATPGTGTCAVGDYVVCGSVVARNATLAGANPKVCKATAAATAIVYKWRILALYGTGAVGQAALIESV